MDENGRPNVIELLIAALRKQAAILALLSGPATITLHVNPQNERKPVTVELHVKV